MPISWITVLQSVPWSDVISNAPRVAEGARKLWGMVTRREGEGHDAATPVDAAEPPPTPQQLQARIAALEEAVSRLDEQMLASSELIKALAEQNAQLIRRLEIHRVRSTWLAAGVVLALGIAIGLGVWLWSGQRLS